MEAAEGETTVSSVGVRRVDVGGREEQEARVRWSRVRRARPGAGGATGAVQSAIVRIGVANAHPPQRRKRNRSCCKIYIYNMLTLVVWRTICL